MGNVLLFFGGVVLGVALIMRIVWRQVQNEEALHHSPEDDFARAPKIGPWVVLDTETTGLSPNAEIIEISIIDKDGSVLLNTLVKPKGPISGKSRSIHGIDRKMVKDAPSWPEVAPAFEAAITGKTVIAYNAKFDVRIVRQTYLKHGLPAPDIKSHCAMEAYGAYCGNRTRRKLARVCAAHHIKYTGQHRALADADATRRLINALELDHDPSKVPPKRGVDLRIKYEDRHGNPVERKIRAWRLYTNSNDVDMVSAWCYQDNKTKTFKLDKIHHATHFETGKKFNNWDQLEVQVNR